MSPVEFLLSIMRDETQEGQVRIDAAVQVAPYCHARLASTTLKAEGDALVPTVVIRHFVPYDDPRVGTRRT